MKYRLLLLCLILCSCAIKPRAKIDAIGEAKGPEPETVAAAIPEYRLGFGDVIEVKFFNNSQFNEQLVIRPDGRISMERVGDIPVTGLTPAHLSGVISEAYGRIIKNPEVTVIVREFGGIQVYVLGEVNKPGAYPLQRDLSILQSIALAGGHKDSAKLKSIILMRRDPDGAMNASRIDLSGPSPDSIQQQDVRLTAFDIVYVPKTFIANVNTFLDQALSGIIQPLDIYLRAVWWSR